MMTNGPNFMQKEYVKVYVNRNISKWIAEEKNQSYDKHHKAN